ncbi:MAG TPA: hypothetical protein VJU82_14295 [Acidobacteriaceae bacterium]|nr:hypothetical protein [Acidobacteriaceae bacterium]
MDERNESARRMLSRREMIMASSATVLAGSFRSAPLNAHVRDKNPYLNLVAESELSGFSSYFALEQTLRSMRANATTVRTRPGQFADVFTDQTGINAGASRYYDYDARKVVGTQRVFKNTVAPEEDFEAISDWSTNVGVTVVDARDPDPMVGKVAEMNTGGTRGSVSILRNYYGPIPASFGVSVLMGMVTNLTSAAEALEMQVQNNQGHQLKMRVYSGAVDFFHDGAWHTQFPYGGSIFTLTEWWVEVTFNGGSNYRVRLFAGTQELPGFTGNLPHGTSGENGWIGFIQHSSTRANRKSHLAFLQVGSSALPANMSLVSVAQDVMTEPTAVSLAVMFEDVCAQTVINTDLKGWISKDGGANYYQVTLKSYDEWGGGVLDVSKPVLFLAGTVTLPPSGTHNVCCRITSANGRYFSLNGYAWRVEA